MSHKSSRRRSPPGVIWLLLGGAGALLLSSLVLGFWSQRQSRQIQRLEVELEAWQGKNQATETQLVALQGIATALEQRLDTLEASDPAQQLATIQASLETASTPQQIEALHASLAEVQVEIGEQQAALADLVARMDALSSDQGETAPTVPAQVRLPVDRQRQSHNLSCESSAASMAAHYHGVSLSEAEVLVALPLNDNPYLGFRGNVDGETGGIGDYGVYAGPVMDILNDRGLRASPVEGGLDGIQTALARGNPVIAWITYDCQRHTPTTATIGGETVPLVPYQHAVVVTGYNNQGVWANDPWDGQEDFYTTADFQRALGYLGDMALEVAVP